MNEKMAIVWIKIAGKLSADPYDRVFCPKCEQYILEVLDYPVDDTHFGRLVRCPECDFSEEIYMIGKPVKLGKNDR